MPKTINSVAISGNLGRDAELKTTRNGKPVVSFDLAVTSARKDGDGWATKANWVPVTWWGDEAADKAPLLVKGRGLVIHGRLNMNEWEQDGQRRRKLEVVAESVILAEKKDDLYDADIPF